MYKSLVSLLVVSHLVCHYAAGTPSKNFENPTQEEKIETLINRFSIKLIVDQELILDNMLAVNPTKGMRSNSIS